MKMKLIAITLAALSIGASASNYEQPWYLKGSVEFSDEEKSKHLEILPNLEKQVEECLQHEITEHQTFFKKWGFSRYYGDQSAFAKAIAKGDKELQLRMIRDAALASKTVRYKNGFTLGHAEYFLEEKKVMKPVSCIGLTLICLDRAFKHESVNTPETWQKIKSFTKENGQTGASLQFALQALGWKIAYFNTDPSQNELRDAKEIERKYPDHQKGHHKIRFNEVNNKSSYYSLELDDTTSLVDFKNDAPQSFKNVGLFIGVAHNGYHVFPGYRGFVVEGHSAMALTKYNTIEAQVFNPSDYNGAPKGEFHSGTIVVPPTYELKSKSQEAANPVRKPKKKKKNIFNVIFGGGN
jgi:hypothetical protein